MMCVFESFLDHWMLQLIANIWTAPSGQNSIYDNIDYKKYLDTVFIICNFIFSKDAMSHM